MSAGYAPEHARPFNDVDNLFTYVVHNITGLWVTAIKLNDSAIDVFVAERVFDCRAGVAVFELVSLVLFDDFHNYNSTTGSKNEEYNARYAIVHSMTTAKIFHILASHYHLGEQALTAERISAGVENANYLVRDGHKKYVFRVYNATHSIRGERTLASIEQELSFMLAAGANGLTVPTPIRTTHSKVIGKTGATFFALFSFSEGVQPHVFNASVASEFAHALDVLYKVGGRFAKTAHHEDLSISKRALAKYESLSKLPMISSHITEVIDTLHADLQANLVRLGNLRRGFVHGDLKLENTLFVGNRLSAVLDFDDYRYTYLLEETVMAMMHRLHKPEQNCIRSGNYENLVDAITNPQLKAEINTSLKTLLRARLLYDLCKCILDDELSLIKPLLSDEHIQRHILS